MISNHKHRLETFSEEGGLLVHPPKSSENRLILHFTARHYCRHGIGLQDMNLPSKLHDLGVDEYEWNNMMQKLQKEVQPFAPSYCCLKFYRILAFFGMFCCLWHAEGKYQKKLEKWVEALNSKVLSKKNLYAKIQSNEINIRSYSETVSWLAISMNFEDAEMLKEEPSVWTPKCCSNEIGPIECCCERIIFCFGPKRII